MSQLRKVTVSIPEVHISYITLEVGDAIPDYEIKEKANDLLEAGGYQDNLEYSHTMDMDMWDITDEVEDKTIYKHECLTGQHKQWWCYVSRR